MVKILHHGVVYQGGIFEMDAYCSLRRQGIQFCFYSQVIGEYCRSLKMQMEYLAFIFHQHPGFEKTFPGSSLEDVNHQFQRHTGSNPNQKVFEQRKENGGQEDCELFWTDFVGVNEFLGVSQFDPYGDQHSSQGCIRNHLQ